MSQVNLLPKEIRQQEQVRRRFVLVSLAAGGLAGLVVLYFFMQTLTLAGVRSDLRAQEATNQGIQKKIDRLQQYADLQKQVEAKRAVIDQVYLDEVAWSSVLMRLSRTIPSDAYLKTMTGSVGQPAGAGGAAPPASSSLVGNITLTGTALGTDSVTLWLTRLDQVVGFANASTSSVSEQDELSGIYDFSDAADLTVDAVTKRGGRGR